LYIPESFSQNFQQDYSFAKISLRVFQNFLQNYPLKFEFLKKIQQSQLTTITTKCHADTSKFQIPPLPQT
jgi:hypothetical protein